VIKHFGPRGFEGARLGEELPQDLPRHVLGSEFDILPLSDLVLAACFDGKPEWLAIFDLNFVCYSLSFYFGLFYIYCY